METWVNSAIEPASATYGFGVHLTGNLLVASQNFIAYFKSYAELQINGTAGPSTSLRSGRDDEFMSGTSDSGHQQNFSGEAIQ